MSRASLRGLLAVLGALLLALVVAIAARRPAASPGEPDTASSASPGDPPGALEPAPVPALPPAPEPPPEPALTRDGDPALEAALRAFTAAAEALAALSATATAETQATELPDDAPSFERAVAAAIDACNQASEEAVGEEGALDVETEEGGTAPTVTAAPEAPVRVTVRDARGRPARGALVVLQGADGALEGHEWSPLAPEVRPTGPDRSAITALAFEGGEPEEPVILERDQPQDRAFKTARALLARGRVPVSVTRAAGAPRDPAWITLALESLPRIRSVVGGPGGAPEAAVEVVRIIPEGEFVAGADAPDFAFEEPVDPGTYELAARYGPDEPLGARVHVDSVTGTALVTLQAPPISAESWLVHVTGPDDTPVEDEDLRVGVGIVPDPHVAPDVGTIEGILELSDLPVRRVGPGLFRVTRGKAEAARASLIGAGRDSFERCLVSVYVACARLGVVRRAIELASIAPGDVIPAHFLVPARLRVRVAPYEGSPLEGRILVCLDGDAWGSEAKPNAEGLATLEPGQPERGVSLRVYVVPLEGEDEATGRRLVHRSLVDLPAGAYERAVDLSRFRTLTVEAGGAGRLTLTPAATGSPTDLASDERDAECRVREGGRVVLCGVPEGTWRLAFEPEGIRSEERPAATPDGLGKPSWEALQEPPLRDRRIDRVIRVRGDTTVRLQGE